MVRAKVEKRPARPPLQLIPGFGAFSVSEGKWCANVEELRAPTGVYHTPKGFTLAFQRQIFDRSTPKLDDQHDNRRSKNSRL